jgi:hypothetical protein
LLNTKSKTVRTTNFFAGFFVNKIPAFNWLAFFIVVGIWFPPTNIKHTGKAIPVIDVFSDKTSGFVIRPKLS